jgi:tRNA-specific 2-thiouridylase
VPATAHSSDGVLTVELAEPLRGVAPGQAVALYDGDRVLGSATIEATTA